MSRKLDDLHPDFRRQAMELLARLTERGIAVMIVDTYRTQAEQDDYLRRGLSKVRHSKHQDGKAMDVAPYETYLMHGADKLAWDAELPAWRLIGEIAESLGLRWGGRFGEKPPGAGNGWDPGHVELPG